jgi:hypothetical protein
MNSINFYKTALEIKDDRETKLNYYFVLNKLKILQKPPPASLPPQLRGTEGEKQKMKEEEEKKQQEKQQEEEKKKEAEKKKNDEKSKSEEKNEKKDEKKQKDEQKQDDNTIRQFRDERYII